jgi:hypothetical protein
MMYLATPSSPAIREAMLTGLLGQLVTGRSNPVIPGVSWALDNGCFSDRWTEQAWLTTLDRYVGVPRCLFAVVPDVVGDAAVTDARWYRYADMVRDRGYRTAYVTQNGCTRVPDDADVVFTGGDDEWKLSAQAQRLASRSGRPTHMGRVNSLRRLRFAAAHGYDTVDGTFLTFGPDINLPRLLRYLRHADHPVLFDP